MKLLSNDELIKALTSIDLSDGIIGFTHLDERDAYKLLPLIQEQKIAHGDMVIGEDYPIDYPLKMQNHAAGVRNDEHAKQRERNK